MGITLRDSEIQEYIKLSFDLQELQKTFQNDMQKFDEFLNDYQDTFTQIQEK